MRGNNVVKMGCKKYLQFSKLQNPKVPGCTGFLETSFLGQSPIKLFRTPGLHDIFRFCKKAERFVNCSRYCSRFFAITGFAQSYFRALEKSGSVLQPFGQGGGGVWNFLFILDNVILSLNPSHLNDNLYSLMSFSLIFFYVG